MARLMLSAGMFSPLAARIAARRRGLLSGSPPPFLAAMLISLMRRVNILPRFASSAPFLCLIVAHFEWPDIGILFCCATDIARLALGLQAGATPNFSMEVWADAARSAVF